LIDPSMIAKLAHLYALNRVCLALLPSYLYRLQAYMHLSCCCTCRFGLSTVSVLFQWFNLSTVYCNSAAV